MPATTRELYTAYMRVLRPYTPGNTSQTTRDTMRATWQTLPEEIHFDKTHRRFGGANGLNARYRQAELPTRYLIDIP
jgi:hypothetical protein